MLITKPYLLRILGISCLVLILSGQRLDYNHAPSLNYATYTPRVAVRHAAIPAHVEKRRMRFQHAIYHMAHKHGVDARLIQAVILAESSFNHRAISKARAKGLMQLTHPTAKMLGVKDVFDPYQNIDGGTRYLKQLLKRFNNLDLALAAYNAGPTRVSRLGAIPPYRETQNYVKKVKRYIHYFKSEPAPIYAIASL